jgi:hypothetical protein
MAKIGRKTIIKKIEVKKVRQAHLVDQGEGFFPIQCLGI